MSNVSSQLGICKHGSSSEVVLMVLGISGSDKRRDVRYYCRRKYGRETCPVLFFNYCVLYYKTKIRIHIAYFIFKNNNSQTDHDFCRSGQT